MIHRFFSMKRKPLFSLRSGSNEIAKPRNREPEADPYRQPRRNSWTRPFWRCSDRADLARRRLYAQPGLVPLEPSLHRMAERTRARAIWLHYERSFSRERGDGCPVRPRIVESPATD